MKGFVCLIKIYHHLPLSSNYPDPGNIPASHHPALESVPLSLVSSYHILYSIYQADR